jgi:pimeloyl-ACP methyl ester carboxylesterase
MAEVTVNGVRLAYEVHGQGEPIVLLPATGMVKEAWPRVGPAPALVDAGYQVVLVDNRGAGASDAPPAPYSVADLAADTAGLIQQLGLGPCRLVGFSLGGLIAEHLAAERADLVRAAALLGSAGPPTAYMRLAIDAERELASHGIELLRRKQIADTIRELFTPAQLQDDALVETWIAGLSARPGWGNPGRHGQFAADHAWIEEFQATHAARWAKISVPLLVVAFEHDASVRPSGARQLAQAVPGAELSVIPGASHGGVFTHASEVGEVLLKFFASVG